MSSVWTECMTDDESRWWEARICGFKANVAYSHDIHGWTCSWSEDWFESFESMNPKEAKQWALRAILERLEEQAGEVRAMISKETEQ